jgi:ribosome-associated protein
MKPRFTVSDNEVEISAIRAQGAGGQNVNKVSNAIHLRFDINASSLPEEVRDRLLKLNDQRISKDGIVVIKAQEFRSLEGNRAEAMRRLHELIGSVAVLPKRRRPTKPTRSSVKKRLEGKTRRATIKVGRGKVSE